MIFLHVLLQGTLGYITISHVPSKCSWFVKIPREAVAATN